MTPLPGHKLLRGELFDDFRTLSSLLKKDVVLPGGATVFDLRRLILTARDEVDLARDPAVRLLVNKYARYPVNETTPGITFAARRVCRINNFGSDFTGILVGPDLVLTTAHDFRDRYGGDSPRVEHVKVFFDDFVFSDGETYFVECLPASTTSGRAEVVARSDPQALDYVVFRLAVLLGLGPTTDGRRRRGWMDGNRVEVLPAGKVIVLQHAADEYLRWADGDVAELQPHRSAGRYVYDTDTDPGSSGAAVLNEARQLVGMHVRADPTRNGGVETEHLVSFQAIVQHLNGEGVLLPRYPPPPDSMQILANLTANRRLAQTF